MKKPELKDFGLTEELLKQNKSEHETYYERLESHLKYRESVRNKILVVSLVVSVILLIINIAKGFEKNFAGISLGICLFWDVVYGLTYFQSKGESKWDLSLELRNRIESEVINRQIDEAVKKYEEALREYEKKAFTINKYSLVKADLVTPMGTSVGIRWIVFSNIYLANSRSFPDIEIPYIMNKEFQDYYYKLTTKQKDITPIPKKHLNIQDKIEFYYPFSDMFFAMEGKKPRDTAELLMGSIRYRILDVINPDFDE